MLDIPDGQVVIRMYVKKLGMDEGEECSSELYSKTQQIGLTQLREKHDRRLSEKAWLS
jgi:hypothetical protein